MPKISRPIIYSALGAVAVYAIFLNTQPDTSTTRRTVRVARAVAKPDPNGLLPQDLNAHFPRYDGGGRDSFVPGVAVAKPKIDTAASSRASGIRTGWSLTGISAVNGVSSALIENGGTGESVFLHPGDRWNGLRVVAIRPDNVVFQNALGRQDSLTFADPDDDKAAGRGVDVPSAPRLPGLGQPQSLAPFPVAPLRATPLSRAAAPLPPLQGAPAPPDDNGPSFDPQQQDPNQQ